MSEDKTWMDSVDLQTAAEEATEMCAEMLDAHTDGDTEVDD